jgi:hypothetical protein
VIVTEFHDVALAPVIDNKFETVIELRTRYAVPVSVLCTVALAVFAIVAVVALAVGALVSTRCEALAVIAECVSVELFPAASAIVPLLSSRVLADTATPSASVSPLATV